MQNSSTWAASSRTRNLKICRRTTPAASPTYRLTFTGFPNAQRPPFVLKGDTFASDYYWHGNHISPVRQRLGQAPDRRQGQLCDDGDGRLRLHERHRAPRPHASRVDPAPRPAVLRSGSSFFYAPPRRHTAVESVTAPYISGTRVATSNLPTWLTAAARSSTTCSPTGTATATHIPETTKPPPAPLSYTTAVASSWKQTNSTTKFHPRRHPHVPDTPARQSATRRPFSGKWYITRRNRWKRDIALHLVLAACHVQHCQITPSQQLRLALASPPPHTGPTA